MPASESNAAVLEVAEEFLARYRAGQRPPLSEYTDRHPHLAAEIREVFPAMAMMERIAIADRSLAAAAMAHTKLGSPAEAQDCFDRAEAWVAARRNLSAQHAAELKAFAAETAGVLRSGQD